MTIKFLNEFKEYIQKMEIIYDKEMMNNFKLNKLFLKYEDTCLKDHIDGMSSCP